MPGLRNFVAWKRYSVHCAAMFFALTLAGQQPRNDPQPFRLHVYTNLMQVPALVLDTSDRPLKHIDTSHFSITLGDGPSFRPTYVRLQGDDPISLSILLDLSGDLNEITPALRAAISALAPDQLHPRDHVSVYALDCTLLRSADDLPASPAMLTAAFDNAVNNPKLHGRNRKRPACGNTVPLVNALALIAKPLAQLPGRRVILVLSNGDDGKSSLKWSQLRQFTAERGIAVFGMTYPDAQQHFLLDPYTTASVADIDNAANPFAMLCDLTGGIALPLLSGRDASKVLPELVQMLRGRYILEFHRANDTKPGRYAVTVNLDHAPAHIRVGGTTVHVASAAELAPPEVGSSAPDPTSESPAQTPLQRPPTDPPQ